MNASRRAIGFDLGTTISVAATVGPDGIPRTINDSSGSFLVPSAVYFGDDVTVGESAMAAGLSDPEGFAEGFKRDIGKPHYERDIRFCQVPPEVLTAFLVEHLVNRVRDNLGPVHEAVVTVPAYFDEKKRTSTQQAARLAGLKVLDIINEPTAAAIAAAHQLLREQAAASRGRRILVYDLGGGTFDVTLLELRGRTFHTLGTDGDIHLGGSRLRRTNRQYGRGTFSRPTRR